MLCEKLINHFLFSIVLLFGVLCSGQTKSELTMSDYAPGDIVCWDLGDGLTHIGIVVDNKSIDEKRNLIVHNIGAGQVAEDVLFSYKIIGYYRYKQ